METLSISVAFADSNPGSYIECGEEEWGEERRRRPWREVSGASLEWAPGVQSERRRGDWTRRLEGSKGAPWFGMDFGG